MRRMNCPDSAGLVQTRPWEGATNGRAQRYELLGKLASGGMGTVHLARMRGPLGFSRLVAIKTMNPRHASDPAACAMFLDEAQITAQLRHPNIVGTVDFVAERGELMLVMDYVEGDSLRAIQKAARAANMRLPVPVACAIARDVLAGLHAAHEARDEEGHSLGVIHRDVSPDNVIVGLDGITRLLDFGVAHARSTAHEDESGSVRGKLVYMAPEQLAGEAVDRTIDIYSVGALLWEALTGHRLYRGSDDATITQRILERRALTRPSASAPGIPPALDAVVLRMLAHDPRRRPRTALAAAHELEAAAQLASAAEIGRWATRFARPRPTPPSSSRGLRTGVDANGPVSEPGTLSGVQRSVVRTKPTLSQERDLSHGLAHEVKHAMTLASWGQRLRNATPMLVLFALLAVGGLSAFGLTMRATVRSADTVTATQRCASR